MKKAENVCTILRPVLSEVNYCVLTYSTNL